MGDVVEKVARALDPVLWGRWDIEVKGFLPKFREARLDKPWRAITERLDQARAALEACHHEELITALQNCCSLVELKFGNTDPTGNAAIAQADAVLAKVEASHG